MICYFKVCDDDDDYNVFLEVELCLEQEEIPDASMCVFLG